MAPFLFIGFFHLHFALTVGDWGFWADWKGRQWRPLVTPLIGITLPAAARAVLWSRFRPPSGAAPCVACLSVGTWIARVFAYHF